MTPWISKIILFWGSSPLYNPSKDGTFHWHCAVVQWCRATGPPRGSATNLVAERRGRSDMLIQPGSGKIYHMKSYVHCRCNVMYTIYLIYCVCVYRERERYIYRVMVIVIQVNTLCVMCTGVLYEGKHRFIPISKCFRRIKVIQKASNHGLCMSSSKTMVPPKKRNIITFH